MRIEITIEDTETGVELEIEGVPENLKPEDVTMALRAASVVLETAKSLSSEPSEYVD